MIYERTQIICNVLQIKTVWRVMCTSVYLDINVKL